MESWMYHDSFLLFTDVSRGSCAPARPVVRLWTKSLVWISARDTCNRHRKHLLSNARIFVNAPDTVQFSQPQIGMETARACWVLSLLLLRGLFGSGPLCPTVYIWWMSSRYIWNHPLVPVPGRSPWCQPGCRQCSDRHLALFVAYFHTGCSAKRQVPV